MRDLVIAMFNKNCIKWFGPLIWIISNIFYCLFMWTQGRSGGNQPHDKDPVSNRNSGVSKALSGFLNLFTVFLCVIYYCEFCSEFFCSNKTNFFFSKQPIKTKIQNIFLFNLIAELLSKYLGTYPKKNSWW